MHAWASYERICASTYRYGAKESMHDMGAVIYGVEMRNLSRREENKHPLIIMIKIVRRRSMRIRLYLDFFVKHVHGEDDEERRAHGVVYAKEKLWKLGNSPEMKHLALRGVECVCVCVCRLPQSREKPSS